jgi:hypothetical protein
MTLTCNHRGFALTVIAAFVFFASNNAGAADDASVLRGAIDIHVHSFPDSRPRSLNAVQAAQFARDAGMRAIVLKNHYESTAGLAYVVRAVVPGIEVFGGIDLNLPVGGINVAAVDYMIQESGGWGRFVWMPTFDSENAVRYDKQNRPFVSVARNGALLPEVVAVIAKIAEHDLILATGHSAAEEGLLLLREGRRAGVKRMVVTHAMNPPILMNVAQMQAAAKLGGYIEFVAGSLTEPEAPARIEKFADAIRKIGPQFCILSSDLGQKNNALPTEGFAAFLQTMKSKGFSEQDIDRMARQNPAQLLGLH